MCGSGHFISVRVGPLGAAMTEQEQAAQQPSEGLSLVSAFRGYRLHPTVWKPTEPAKALVFVCHGVGEYMGRYEELGSHLSQNGLLMFGHDHVGHGRSEGDRVYVEDIDTYVQDVIHHVELMKSDYPHLPCILMGHSMGGLIAGHVAIQRSDLFTCLILSAAAAEIPDPRFSIWIVKKAFQLLSHVVPQLGVKSIDINDISSIPEEVERYANDPLVWHGPLKARWVAAMLTSIDLFRENVERITLPLLLIHGREDQLVPITASHFINDNAASQEKRFEVFEDSRHETLHDKDQERAKELIKDWVLAHLTDPEPAAEHTSQPTPSSESQPTEESTHATSRPEQTAEGTEQATIPQESESSQPGESEDT